MKQTVIIYTSTLCPICDMVKSLLDTLAIQYKEINIDINPIAMFQLIVKIRRLSVPQTLIKGELISGFNPEKIMQVLNKY
ncbi:glutaredoxin family protein [Amphibacillus sp. Q70]|uniref:glutaredoxin family protein n=1 Tax=Amphibacillus sp. Q70 TaxID=3453416 RepID=UPI003F87FA23